jgi:hypothetical protein
MRFLPRFLRHEESQETKCPRCGVQWDALEPADRLLDGLGMVPVPLSLVAVAAQVSHPSVSHPTVVE